MRVMCEEATSPWGNPHMSRSFCCFAMSPVAPPCSHCMGPMDNLEDSDIYLVAAGLERLLREYSGHGRELGKARQL